MEGTNPDVEVGGKVGLLEFIDAPRGADEGLLWERDKAVTVSCGVAIARSTAFVAIVTDDDVFFEVVAFAAPGIIPLLDPDPDPEPDPDPDPASFWAIRPDPDSLWINLVWNDAVL